MTALPIADAAAELGISTPTLKRWIRSGAPVSHRGRRGRGCAARIDPDAVLAWKRGHGGEDALTTFASRIPEIVAAAIAEAHRLTDGPHKIACAGVLAACWYLVATGLLDELREAGANVSEPSKLPEQIERLRLIAGK